MCFFLNSELQFGFPHPTPIGSQNLRGQGAPSHKIEINLFNYKA